MWVEHPPPPHKTLRIWFFMTLCLKSMSWRMHAGSPQPPCEGSWGVGSLFSRSSPMTLTTFTFYKWFKKLNFSHIIQIMFWFIHLYLQGETELSFRLIPSLTQSHTKPHTKTVREAAKKNPPLITGPLRKKELFLKLFLFCCHLKIKIILL